MQAPTEQLFAEALRTHQAGRIQEAEQQYREILAADPQHADALHLLGVIALQTGHASAALTLIDRAVSLRPDGAIYHSNRGQVLERLGRSDDAERAYRTAIETDAACTEALNNLGRLLQARDRLTEAESLFRRAIALAPDYAEPWTNLANLLKDRGDLDAAIDAARRAVDLRPDLSMLHSNLLLMLHYHTDYSPAELAREHRIWSERHASRFRSDRSAHDNDADPDRRIRIGYLSPDFRDHAITRFMRPLLERHNREAVEVFAYSDVAKPDAITTAIRSCCDHWRDVAGMADAEVAAAIRRDAIDILVDLSAHSGLNRLLTFARKPAPVQISYLAYCSTTGLDAIDYRLTDRFLDPTDQDQPYYSETSIRLPGCYWCYAAPDLSASSIPSSDRAEGPPTFGCLNNFAKITDQTLTLWTRILGRIPEAELLVYARTESHRDRLRRALQLAGLSVTRLKFVGWQSFEQYLETYRRIDVALDPFPYGGGTTSCDALWMGVPVVTLTGRTAVSRAGATLLSNAGLTNLIAATADQYVDTASELIRDSDRLAGLRRELRGRFEASPVMDATQFAADMEAVYRQVWHRWCADRTSGR